MGRNPMVMVIDENAAYRQEVQAMLTPARLAERIEALVADPTRLKEMGERARALAVPDAAERIVAVLLESA